MEWLATGKQMSLDQKGRARTNSGSSFLGAGGGVGEVYVVGMERDTNTTSSLSVPAPTGSLHRPSFSYRAWGLP